MSDYEFDWYQQEAAKTAIYRNKLQTLDGRLMYVMLGLMSEVGEIADKLKKAQRDSEYFAEYLRRHATYGAAIEAAQDTNSHDTELELIQLRHTIEAELGDVLWYLAMLADEFNLPLQDVMLRNINKLASRQKRNKLQGSGDDR